MDLLDQLDSTLGGEEVDIITFAESPKFCNSKLYPRQKLLLKLMFLEDLSPAEDRILDYWIAGGNGGNEIEVPSNIRERIEWLKSNGYKHFPEVVLVGGRRCSKGHVTAIAMAKLMYDAMRLGDPGKHYGIEKDKTIVFSVVAAAQDQAKEMQYSDFRNRVESCYAMQNSLGDMQELKFSVLTQRDKDQIALRKKNKRRVDADTASLRGNALPANARTLRGSTTMAIVFDEMAHFQQGENDQSDKEVYSAAKPALAQFGRAAMVFCNSSPYSKVGTFYERFQEGIGQDEDTGEWLNNRIFPIRLPSWALFEGWWEDEDYVNDPDTPNKCITVAPDWDPERKNPDGSYFYCEHDRIAIEAEKVEEASDPIKYRVERRGEFAEVVDAYLDPDLVDRMYLGRPYETEVEEGDEVVIKRYYNGYQVNRNNNSYTFDYYAHIDPSSTTAGFGFALGHVEPFFLRGEHQDHVVFDIIQRWNPQDFPDKVIDWDPILEERLLYCDIFRPKKLTFDEHQTAAPMTWLKNECRKRGIGTNVHVKKPNIQTNWNRAEVFRTALYQDLVHAPHGEPDIDYSSQELKFLQEIKTGRVPRVEHQTVGPIQTKDIADAMMEVVESCIGNEIAISERNLLGETNLRMGGQGGYVAGFTPVPGLNERGARGPMAEHYGRRGNNALASPTRRAFGARPQSRRLPRRRLPI